MAINGETAMSAPVQGVSSADSEQLKATRPDPSLLPADEVERYTSRALAMDLFLAGAKPAEIEAASGITRQELHRIRQRFFARREDGQLYGYASLIGYSRIAAYTRTVAATIKKGLYRGGYSGCFLQLMTQLKGKGVFKRLNDRIDGKTIGPVAAAGLNVQAIHKAWLEDLEAAGASRSAWPFTTKNLGYNTLAKYAREYLQQSTTARLRKYGRDALGMQDAHSLKTGWMKPGVWDIACYDEQVFPAIGTILLELDGKQHEIATERFCLCLLVLKGSRANAAYHIAYRRRVAAADFMETFSRFLTRWSAKSFKAIPTLAYHPNAGFPTMVPGFLENVRIAYLQIDNDLTHYANVVLEYLSRKLGLHIQFGEEGRPVTRYAVEQVFSQLQTFIASIPSTTGSGPFDPKRTDPAAQALAHGITMDGLEELVEVILARMNATPREELRGATPLEVIRRACATNEGIGCVVPGYNPATLNDLPLPVNVVRVTIRGNIASGETPHVHMDGADYTSVQLRSCWDLCGKPALAHLFQDHRLMKLFTLDGRPLGIVEATGHWSRSYHDKQTRMEVRQLIKDGVLKMNREDDPIEVARHHYAKQAALRAASRPKNIAPEALKIKRMDRASHEFGAVHQVQASKPPNVQQPGKSRGAAWRVGRKTTGDADGN